MRREPLRYLSRQFVILAPGTRPDGVRISCSHGDRVIATPNLVIANQTFEGCSITALDIGSRLGEALRYGAWFWSEQLRQYQAYCYQHAPDYGFAGWPGQEPWSQRVHSVRCPTCWMSFGWGCVRSSDHGHRGFDMPHPARLQEIGLSQSDWERALRGEFSWSSS